MWIFLEAASVEISDSLLMVLMLVKSRKLLSSSAISVAVIVQLTSAAMADWKLQPFTIEDPSWKARLDLQHVACLVSLGKGVKPSKLTNVIPSRPAIPDSHTRLLMVGDIELHVPVTYAAMGALWFEEVQLDPRSKYYPFKIGRGNGKQFATGDRTDGLPYVAGRSIATIHGNFLHSIGWLPAGRYAEIEIRPRPSGYILKDDYPSPLSSFLSSGGALTYSDDCDYIRFPKWTALKINTSYPIPHCRGFEWFAGTIGGLITGGNCFHSVDVSVKISDDDTSIFQDTIMRSLDFVFLLLKQDFR